MQGVLAWLLNSDNWEKLAAIIGVFAIFCGGVWKVLTYYQSRRSESKPRAVVAPEPKTTLGKPVGAPPLPPNYLPRAEHVGPLKEAVLNAPDLALGITSEAIGSGLVGMGGIGKTVAATALAWDSEVRKAFPDGIVWLSFGRHADVVQQQMELVHALGSAPVVVENWMDGRNHLSRLTRDRRCLVILDDVWESQHAEAFTRLGERCRLVVTTRDAAVLQKIGALQHRLDVLEQEKAWEFLAKSAGLDGKPMPFESIDIARLCGNLPLALAVVGALVRTEHLTWEEVRDRLEAADIDHLRAKLPSHEGVLPALEISVDALPDRERAAFLDCAVFPEDVAIPEPALETLWTQRFTDLADARDAAQLLVERSLVSRDDQRRYRLHDLYQDYLRYKIEDVIAAHGRLLAAYRSRCCNGWPSGPDDGYFFQFLAYHLEAAGEHEALRSLALDYDWVVAKLTATSVFGVLDDLSRLGEDQTVNLLKSSLRLSSPTLLVDRMQLPGQLIGRLRGIYQPDVEMLIEKAKHGSGAPWLCPKTNSLHPPGGPLLQTFFGHTCGVDAMAVLPDGRRALSGSSGGDVRLWDLETGAELNRFGLHRSVTAVTVARDGRRVLSAGLEGNVRLWDLETGKTLKYFSHPSAVNCVEALPDGRRALSVSDRILHVWDLQAGVELKRFEAHTEGVNAVAILADGRRVISASWDSTLRLWDLESGDQLVLLEGHGSAVHAVAVFPEGSMAISGGSDATLRLWDLKSGHCIKCLEGHAESVKSVAILPDSRRVLSGSEDKTLRLWDLDSEVELKRLEGHTDSVESVAIVPDSKFALSGSEDGTLRLWNLESAIEFRAFARHSDEVTAIAVCPDGRRGLSSSWDTTLRLWDLQTGTELKRFDGHTNKINAAAVLPDGCHALSGSRDGTMRLWDISTGAELKCWTLGKYSLTTLAVLTDGRHALAGCIDYTLRLWDLETGQEVGLFRGHTSHVSAVTVLPNGRHALSASWDETLRLWDLETGTELKCFKTNFGRLRTVAVLPDGCRALLGSAADKIHLLDLETGAKLRRLEGHGDGVWGVAAVGDGRRALSGSEDHTLRVWDLEASKCIATFTGDAAITSVAFAGPNSFVAGSANGAIHILQLRKCQRTLTF
ncbi:MAG: hypothetical protein IPM60_15780 [Rhodospirillales bacterium]|nr:hypothetical protein [Rhodospirillales bacterium]